ncbi:MAG: hypothetical protein ACK5NN_10315 [Sphingomonadaceae bacterium]
MKIIYTLAGVGLVLLAAETFVNNDGHESMAERLSDSATAKAAQRNMPQASLGQGASGLATYDPGAPSTSIEPEPEPEDAGPDTEDEDDSIASGEEIEAVTRSQVKVGDIIEAPRGVPKFVPIKNKK